MPEWRCVLSTLRWKRSSERMNEENYATDSARLTKCPMARQTHTIEAWPKTKKNQKPLLYVTEDRYGISSASSRGRRRDSGEAPFSFFSFYLLPIALSLGDRPFLSFTGEQNSRPSRGYEPRFTEEGERGLEDGQSLYRLSRVDREIMLFSFRNPLMAITRWSPIDSSPADFRPLTIPIACRGKEIPPSCSRSIALWCRDLFLCLLSDATYNVLQWPRLISVYLDKHGTPNSDRCSRFTFSFIEMQSKKWNFLWARLAWSQF